MIVNRYLVINPIEPVPLSMRLPCEMPVTVNIAFTTPVTDAPIAYELNARLEVTGRTDGKQKVYPAPSTDLSNGKVAAQIPEGDLKDKNGYQVRLFGDVQLTPGAPSETLIAIGTIRLIECGL